MAKHKPKPKQSRWASEAAQQALLRFGPELSALKELQRTAESTYNSAVLAARGTAKDIKATIQNVRPGMTRVFDEAAARNAQIQAVPLGDIAGANIPASIKAGSALEQQTANSNLNQLRTTALTDLSQRKVQATQGAAFAQKQAQNQLVKDLTGILRRKQDLAKERGTFTALTTSQLTDAARERALKVRIQNLQNRGAAERNAASNKQSERNSLRSAGIDPDTGKPIPGGKADPKAKAKAKLHTAGEHQTAKDAISKGIAALQTLDPDKSDRHGSAPLLISGHKSQQLYQTVPAPTTTNPKGTKQVPRIVNGVPVTTPDIPGVGSWATIAADVYYDGHLSRANQRKLQAAHYSVKELGLPTYGEWKRAQQKPRPFAPNYYQGG